MRCASTRRMPSNGLTWPARRMTSLLISSSERSCAVAGAPAASDSAIPPATSPCVLMVTVSFTVPRASPRLASPPIGSELPERRLDEGAVDHVVEIDRALDQALLGIEGEVVGE